MVLGMQASWCSPRHGHGDTAVWHLTSSPPWDPSPSLPRVPQELSLSFYRPIDGSGARNGINLCSPAELRLFL